MPPRNSVTTLRELCRSVTCDLVVSSAKKIEDLHPCDVGLSLDVVGCLDAVQHLQDFICQLPVTVFESLFQAVLDTVHQRQQTVVDKRILFHAFIHDNVAFTKLAITYRVFKNVEKTLEDQRHATFWLDKIPKLSKLLEVDLKCVHDEDIVLAFTRSCPELLVMRLGRVSSSTLESVLRSCKKLKVLHVKDSHQLVDVLKSITDKKLKLMNLALGWSDGYHLDQLLSTCPDLCDIHVDSDGTMATLASCPHGFKKIDLKYRAQHYEGFSNFCSSKGNLTVDFRIYTFHMSNTDALRVISETCQNLTHLDISCLSVLNVEDICTNNTLSFPNLENLKIGFWLNSNNLYKLIMLVELCTADSMNLDALTLCNSKQKPWTAEDEDAFIRLFTGNPRMKQLVNLDLLVICDATSTETLIRTVLKYCEKLKTLTINGNPLNHDVDLVVRRIIGEVDQKNQDFALFYAL